MPEFYSYAAQWRCSRLASLGPQKFCLIYPCDYPPSLPIKLIALLIIEFAANSIPVYRASVCLNVCCSVKGIVRRLRGVRKGANAVPAWAWQSPNGILVAAGMLAKVMLDAGLR